jgi:polyhydroxyalkanoate synthesis regulator protein
MGSYLERSLQIFMDQQQQFRDQLGTLLGRTPWSMLNDLADRNLDLWNNMQQGLLTAAGRMRKEADQAGASEPKAGKTSR